MHIEKKPASNRIAAKMDEQTGNNWFNRSVVNYSREMIIDFSKKNRLLMNIVDAAKTMVFGGFLEIFGKTIGHINFKLDVYQGSRVLKTIVSIEIDFN